MKRFYRNIVKDGDFYRLKKNNEYFLNGLSLEEALYERDCLESVGWDWDLYLELPVTPNKYENMDLPPYNHAPRYITKTPERWVIKTRGRQGKHIKIIYSMSEAQKYCKSHPEYVAYYYKAICKVVRVFNGERVFFGNYDTFEEAEKRVEELKNNGWDGYELSVE